MKIGLQVSGLRGEGGSKIAIFDWLGQ